MKLSDISIQRPVFAVVMSLLLVVLGFMSFTRLTLRELPAIDPPIVSVSVDYTGASAAVIESRITQVLEDALAGIEGIDTINARSSNGRSQVSIEFTSNRDIEAAANDVRDAVSRVADRMPEEARPPEIAKVESDADPIIWLNMSSTSMDTLELSDYADRYIVDRFSSLDGVAQVRIGGRQRYAMRIWLDRDQLAARGLTVGDVETALRNENVELPAGRIESTDRDFTLRVERNYVKPEDFAGIPLGKGADGYVVRMGDVAKIELASSERRAYYRSNGEPNIGLGIVKTSTANALDVAREARAEADRISSTLPEGTRIFVAFDNTTFIEAAVDRVYATLVEAMLLVLAVIWLFLGSFRAALIPAVTVPVCLIAAFIALYAFGFSINLLTLLALVLCIGLVVDDAIVVVENVQRRIDLGEPPLVASKRGTTQVAFAVIATTAVLVAVFLPVGFLEGNTGRLFRELAVALAAAVALSAFVSLTLTPMMASKLLKPHTGQAPKGLHGVINRNLDRLSGAYGRFLEAHVTRTWVYIVVMILSLLASALLLKVLPSELAPAEDRGSFQIMIDGPEGAGFDYTVGQVQQVEKIVSGFVGEDEPIVRANPRVPGGWGSSEEMHTGRISVFLQPWRQRDVSTPDVAAELQTHLNDLRGVRVRTQVGGGLVRSQGQPFQIVLGGPEYAEIAQWRDRMLLRMADNPGLVGTDSDYKETRPQMRVNIDRQRAADLGVSVTAIGSALETMMGSRRVTTFVDNGEEYDVLVQAGREGRASPSDLAAIRVRASGGELVPLSNLVTLSEVAEAGSLNRFNRLRSITINAGLAPGYPLGEAIAWAQQVASEELPQHAQISWKGESREYQNAGSAVLLTFAMALLVVFLVLAAQFESFIHPLVIMLTVPLGVLGALLGLYVSGGTINLFSQIGIVMLVGLAAKNGILIVEFANQLRDEGRNVHQAIVESAMVRLRPILMTSIATVVGAIPLVVAGGPGSASRGTIGVVVIFGVTVSTFLSLFVVPAFYSLLAPYTRSPEAVARELARQEAETPSVGGHA
ncbi:MULTISPECIES: efflux RND transporter permease subunit [Stenotrophomonas]|jgi:multidrug efflux pump|uniref:Efflux RND transporter permease subunit n=1 Tax=Stenotrophomonas bentonitica TaxID=1450134 RepID=A0ABU9JIP1_9GAMM|nr:MULTISPECIES: efflux RND transporter permease subunit [Stenotrophomonas]AOX61710.1 multidrug transporter AcrB [Stenotrophomonas sp. LM091]MCX2920283.1 efflux RND transporter permease subunit [Stenotrophomonas rhizophila]OFS95581.1 multidrug transporter AcrB [Stenotrophomonas sp. HMSC10F06]WIA61878.1 efflux RND transporter permease subunit [Stenotrophomonas sp. BIO128-Bstrain]